MARSMVGRSQKTVPASVNQPIYKRLGSGYAIHDPRTNAVLGEISRKKRSTEWLMTFRSEEYSGRTIGPLMTLSTALWRVGLSEHTKTPEKPSRQPQPVSLGTRLRGLLAGLGL